MKIGTRIVIVLGLASALLALSSVVSFLFARDILLDSVLERLVSIGNGQIFKIDEYLTAQERNLRAIAGNPLTVLAAAEFGEAFQAAREEADQLGLPGSAELRAELAAWYEAEFAPRVIGGLDRQIQSALPATGSGQVLQSRYLSANPNPVGSKDELLDSGAGLSYDRIHRRYHEYFRLLQREYGLYDLFLVDAETGGIVYSVFKEIDFATSTRFGPQRQSGIATVYEQLARREEGAIIFRDFTPYEPSYLNPAAFMGTWLPGGQAMLIIQFPFDDFNRLMSFGGAWEQNGLQQSGEAFLIGQDRRFRSDPRAFLSGDEAGTRQVLSTAAADDPVSRASASGTLIGSVTAVSEELYAVARALPMGTDQSARVADAELFGRRVVLALRPFPVYGVLYTAVTAVDRDEALADVRATGVGSLISSGIALVVLLSTGFLLARSITRRLSAATRAFSEVSQGSGDLTQRINIQSRDEVGQLASGFNAFAEELNRLIGGAKHHVQRSNALSQDLLSNSEESSSAAEEIAANASSATRQVDDLRSAVSEGSSAIEQITAQVVSLTGQIEKQGDAAAHSARALRALREDIEAAAAEGRERASDSKALADNTRTGRSQVDRARVAMQRVGGTVDTLNQFVAVIEAIAENTNLLALNAEIEAAHAGDAGRGFSVVAAEIRNLAASTAENSAAIREDLQDMVGSVEEAGSASLAVEESFQRIAESVTLVTDSFGSIGKRLDAMDREVDDIDRSTTELSTLSTEVAAGSREMATGAQIITNAIRRIQQASEIAGQAIAEIAAGTAQLSEAAIQVRDLGAESREAVSELAADLGRFRTTE